MRIGFYRSRAKRNTVPIALKTSAREIFDFPWRRSSKMIGMSATRPPLFKTRTSISTWNEYPSAAKQHLANDDVTLVVVRVV